MDNVNERIGKKIKLYRKIKNMTIQELADRIHKSKSMVSKYENAQAALDVETICTIAAALGIKASQFFEEESDWDSSLESGGIAQDKIYMYYYDGRKKKLTKCFIQITPSDNRAKATLYVDYKERIEDCRVLYHGYAEHFDIVDSFTLRNQSNDMEVVHIYSMNSLNSKNVSTGLLMGISEYPVTPAVIKCIFSKTPLPLDAKLKEHLIISKEELKLTKNLNMFLVDNINRLSAL